jgi:hypothetical protein
LEGYDYKIIHCSGIEHENADGISKLMCKWDKSGAGFITVNVVMDDEIEIEEGTEKDCINDKSPKNEFDMKEEQAKCRITQVLVDFVTRRLMLSDNNLKHIIGAEGKNLVLQDGILYRIAPSHVSRKMFPRMQVVVLTHL